MSTSRDTPTFVVGNDGSGAAEIAARFTGHLADALGARLLRATVDGAERATVARRLHDVALGERASLLAVGGVHRYGIGRVPAGGVADHVLQLADRPVLVVPDTARARTSAVGVGAADGAVLASALALADALDADLARMDGSVPGMLRATRDLDLLVVGPAGRDVVAHAECPVLVTPAADGSALTVPGSGSLRAPHPI